VHGEITAHVVVDDAGLSGHGHLTILGMLWHAEDPPRCGPHPGPRSRTIRHCRAVEWAVLRDFLRYGVEEPTGDGAVRIRPDDDGRVMLELDGPEPSLHRARSRRRALRIPRRDRSVVPAGAEAG